MEATVHHVKEGEEHRDWRFREHEACWRWRRAHYEKVLSYRIHDWPRSVDHIGICEDVYKLSQGRPDIVPESGQLRIQSFEIELHNDADRIRSTSVGDVVCLMIIEHTRPVMAPAIFQADRFGFSRIDDRKAHGPHQTHHDGQDTVDESEVGLYAGHECQHCGETITADEHGTGSPLGSMHKSCAQEHMTLHPAQW